MPANKTPAFAVLDLETDPFAPGRLDIKPFLSGFYDGKTVSTFWGVDCVKEVLKLCRKFPGIIYAHNGGKFDFHFLLSSLPLDDCKFFCLGSRIVSIKTPWGCEFRDSYAIIPKPLAAFGKTEINYSWFERDAREKYREKITAYLKDDLRNLFEMVGGFLSRFPAEKTLASATFKLLQRDYGAETGRTSARYDARLRPFYFAGRVQFWQLGRVVGPCHALDINSAFPWAMIFPHAHGEDMTCGNKIPRKFREQSFYVVECESKGDLPLRGDKGGVSFPVGRFVFWVTGWELFAAVEVGTAKILRVETVYTPKECRDFSRFVHDFYGRKAAAKRAGDKAEEFFNKIVLNASYGKHALNPARFEEVAVTKMFDAPEAGNPAQPWRLLWDDPERGLSFHARSSYREGIDKFVNVATAASITGCVRAYLIRSKAKCRGVVYCDTDSIFAADVSKLKMGDGLGEWKKEIFFPGTTPANSFWIAGKKLYAGHGTKPDGAKEWKIASKGVRLTPAQIIRVAQGKKQKHTSEVPTFSVFSAPGFVSRTIRRADKMIP